MPSTNDSMLSFACPRCRARLKVSASQAGTRHSCPRCQLLLEVPRHSQKNSPGEEYPLHRETDPSSSGPPVYIPVICFVCYTRMYGTIEQIGQKIVCPDCGASATVPPPPPESPKLETPVVEAEGYSLRGEVSGAASRAAEESQVRVYCTLCNTLMYAPLNQVGELIACPDCGTLVLVPQPPPLQEKIDPMAGAGEGYPLASRNQVGPTETAPQPPEPISSADESDTVTQAKRDWKPKPRRPTLPRRPLLTGTFSFPFSRNARGYTLGLAVWAAAIFGSLGAAIQMDAVAGFVFVAVGVVMALMWFAFASVCAIGVTRDTADGCDEVQNWPDVAFLEWLGESLYVFMAFSVSLLPGIGLAWLVTKTGRPGELLMLGSVFFAFPIVFLSMLETGSLFGVFSLPVWQTFGVGWRGWATFYLLAALLLTAATVVVMAAFRIAGFFGTVVEPLVFTVVWLSYFRMLGRLALYCTDRGLRAEQAETESDDDDRSEE